MRRTARLALAAAALALFAAAGSAYANTLVVPIDQSTRLSVPGSAYSVLVGNPAVADVTVIDSHTLYVQGKGYGATNLVVLDRDGGSLYVSDLVVSAADTGRVSVYRGPARTDLACAPGCQVTVRSGPNGNAPAPVATPASSGGGVIGTVGAAVANAAP